jgi:hypothetical protein
MFATQPDSISGKEAGLGVLLEVCVLSGPDFDPALKFFRFHGGDDRLHHVLPQPDRSSDATSAPRNAW